jgi:hypothetical protein
MTEGTLVTEGGAGAADPKATAGATPDPKAADAAVGAADPKTVEQAAAAAKDDKAAKDGEADKKAGPPEKYEFKLPDGFKVPDEVRAEYEGAFKELGLTQEQAQKLVDLQIKQEQKSAEQLKSQWEATHNEWVAGFKADKEIGGDEAAQKKSLAFAKKALASEFATPGLAEALEVTGAGNHPEVIRLLTRLGKAVSDDKFVAGTSAPGAKGGVSAKDFYNASGMK